MAKNTRIFVVCSVDDEYGGVNEIITATTDEKKARALAERMNCVIETVEDGEFDKILTGARFYIVELNMRTNEVETVRRLPLGEPRKPDSVESLCERKSGSNIITVVAGSFGEAETKAVKLYEAYKKEKGGTK